VTSARRGLLFDYGGVLTAPVHLSFAAFEAEHGLEAGCTFRVLVDASRTEGGGVIGAIERGELTADDFDGQLRDLLAAAGQPAPPGALLEGLFAGMRPAGALWEVARHARSAGVRVGLLSNSWGLAAYPWDRLADHFDVQVISGQVGLRKPDPAIYELALERLEVEAGRTAFVDDLPRNVTVAEELGMFGVLHDGDVRATAEALGRFLDLDLEVAVSSGSVLLSGRVRPDARGR
jgi:putative hydrolase of the HAD superfamily